MTIIALTAVSVLTYGTIREGGDFGTPGILVIKLVTCPMESFCPAVLAMSGRGPGTESGNLVGSYATAGSMIKPESMWDAGRE